MGIVKIVPQFFHLWNSLPAPMVRASSIKDFKNKFDAHWSNREMAYTYRVEISRTGGRSIFYNKLFKFDHIRIRFRHLDGT